MADYSERRCPICRHRDSAAHPTRDGTLDKYVECPRCGCFQIEDLASSTFNPEHEGKQKTALASHYVRQLQRQSARAHVTYDALWRVLKERSLPNPGEQADSLISITGELLGEDHAGRVDETWQAIASRIGALSPQGAKWIAKELEKTGKVSIGTTITPTEDAQSGLRLTFDGWKTYEELRRRSVHGNQAFMAMQFGVPELDAVFIKHFKPAAREAGFNLIRVDEQPIAGSIDDKLRVEIRNSKFLVADLTNDNRGAYWEAGFAEGLGMPVIYTCEREKFEQKSTHFDTNHHHTVLWSADTPADAAHELKATIRATLPTDAKMTDN